MKRPRGECEARCRLRKQGVAITIEDAMHVDLPRREAGIGLALPLELPIARNDHTGSHDRRPFAWCRRVAGKKRRPDALNAGTVNRRSGHHLFGRHRRHFQRKINSIE